MDAVQGLGQGFALALQPANLTACIVGVLIGTLVGLLPGLGPAATLAMLLPLTFGLGGTGSLIMFAGVYYGARYGGAITSILANLPGETSSVMTCLDGYQMARKGRAGPALGMAAIASFAAGTLGVMGLTIMAPALAQLGLSFGPPEFFSLMVLGLTLVTFLAGKSMTKALMMGCIGLILATSGVDMMSGRPRLTFGQPFLMSGVNMVIVAMGIFAVGEILLNMEQTATSQFFKVPNKLRDLLPTFQDIRESTWSIVRSSFLGFFIGIVPGGSAVIATFLAYGMEKAIARDPESFGTGTIRGVAAPESADNANCSGGMVPLLTLGLPTSAGTAIMLAALTMLGLQPGPLMWQNQPEFFWTVVASMYIGNVLLLILNLPLVPLFANILRVPYHILYPLILAVCSIGIYSLENNVSDVGLLVVFGVFGYVIKKLDYPAAPLVLAMVLGAMMERAMRQSLSIFYGDALGFFQRPMSAVLLGAALLVITIAVIRAVRPRRSAAVQQ